MITHVQPMVGHSVPAQALATHKASHHKKRMRAHVTASSNAHSHAKIATQFHEMAQQARIHDTREQRYYVAKIIHPSWWDSKIIQNGSLLGCATNACLSLSLLGVRVLTKSDLSKNAELLSNAVTKSVDMFSSWSSNYSQSMSREHELKLQAVKDRIARSHEIWRTFMDKLEQSSQNSHSAVLKLFR